MRSIERTLLRWVLSALSIGSVFVALTTYLVTLEEMNEVFDADLQNIAQAVAAYQASRTGVTPASMTLPERHDVPDDSEIITLTWTAQGQLIFSSDPRTRIPFTPTVGLSRPIVDGQEWFIYTAASAQGQGFAQAAQSQAARQEMAAESALQILVPLFVLSTLVGTILLWGLRRSMEPLHWAAHHIAQRSVNCLDPIDIQAVPKEVSPLVQSMNDLLQRLAQAFSAQQRFLADAAHELRTPITALRLQLQLLERSQNDQQRHHATAQLSLGIERASRLIEQLLQVARTEPSAAPTPMHWVDLCALARDSVEILSTKAECLDIDLGIKGSEDNGPNTDSDSDSQPPIWVQGNAALLTVMLNNLIDNALRYTSSGGIVDVAIRTINEAPHEGEGKGDDFSWAVLSVSDNGPGIAESEKLRVFDRFYRGEHAQKQARDGTGSGLGLAIVKAIAEQHGAQVHLSAPTTHNGLQVKVIFRSATKGQGHDRPSDGR